MNQSLNDRLADVFSEISNEFEGFLWCYHEFKGQNLESPIEQLMMAGFLSFHRFGPRLWIKEGKDFADHMASEKGSAITLFTQVPLCDGKYRADFVITRIAPGEKPVAIVVECDGHDFHDRTREQAERDRKRDRETLTAGYRVMRFTGREIWRNPIKCAEEVMWILEGGSERNARL